MISTPNKLSTTREFRDKMARQIEDWLTWETATEEEQRMKDEQLAGDRRTLARLDELLSRQDEASDP